MRLPLPDLFRLSQTAFLLSGYNSIYLIYVGTEIYINLNNKMKVILKTKSQTLKQHYWSETVKIPKTTLSVYKALRIETLD